MRPPVLRDPIWQFIGVVLAIFLTFLTLSPSAQGIAIVGIAITCIFLIFVFARKIGGLSLLTVIFFFIWCIWFFLISGLTYYQVPLFTGTFGLVAPGVVYAKSDIGIGLLITGYILFSISWLLLSLECLIKRDYIMMLSFIFLFVFTLYGSIPALYTPNLAYMRLLFIDWVRPKTFLGFIVCFLGVLGFILFFVSIYMNRDLLIKEPEEAE